MKYHQLKDPCRIRALWHPYKDKLITTEPLSPVPKCQRVIKKEKKKQQSPKSKDTSSLSSEKVSHSHNRQIKEKAEGPTYKEGSRAPNMPKLGVHDTNKCRRNKTQTCFISAFAPVVQQFLLSELYGEEFNISSFKWREIFAVSKVQKLYA